MGIFRRKIKGKKYWVIDRTFRSKEGIDERYRRVAQVQSRAAAEIEERGVIDHWLKHGNIQGLLRSQKSTPKKSGEGAVGGAATGEARRYTWENAVEYFRRVKMPTLKPSTRRGYNGVLDGPHFVCWQGVFLDTITTAALKEWVATLAESNLGSSSRANQIIVMRSVLTCVGPDDEGNPGVMLAALPLLPKLPKVGRVAVDAACPDDVAKLLGEVDDEQRLPVRSAQRRAARLAFALAAHAGLRASEVRALRRQDVDLRRRKIRVRLARCNGEEAPPKSGHEREIPFTGPLEALLKARCQDLEPDDYVAVRADGEPWGDTGLLQALKRACRRLKIEGSRYHALRHFFATTLFGGNVDARTVQELLGHASLEVTQRYAHHQQDRARAAVEVFRQHLGSHEDDQADSAADDEEPTRKAG